METTDKPTKGGWDEEYEKASDFENRLRQSDQKEDADAQLR